LELLPVIEKLITVKYLQKGKLIPKVFKTYFTNHGPIMAERDGKWISLKSKNRNMDGLVQSWVRTKAKGFDVLLMVGCKIVILLHTQLLAQKVQRGKLFALHGA
jgi:hypothetical protein